MGNGVCVMVHVSQCVHVCVGNGVCVCVCVCVCMCVCMLFLDVYYCIFA